MFQERIRDPELEQIALELVDSERHYVNDLYDFIQNYSLIENCDQLNALFLDANDVTDGIKTLYLFNHSLMCQLEMASLDVVVISKCLLNHGFKIYVSYYANYQKRLDALWSLQQNSKVVEFLSAQRTSKKHVLPLVTYLSIPLKRLVQYYLFMKRIVSSATERKVLSDDDLETIKETLQFFKTLYNRAVKEKRIKDSYERENDFYWVFFSLNGQQRNSFKSGYGSLLLQGTFRWSGTITTRNLFLFEKGLLITKQRNCAILCKQFLPLSIITLIECVGPNPLAFQVTSHSDIRYTFIASSMKEKFKWMEELKKLLSDCNATCNVDCFSMKGVIDL